MFGTWTKQMTTVKAKNALHPYILTFTLLTNLCVWGGIPSSFLPRIYFSILAHFVASPPTPSITVCYFSRKLSVFWFHNKRLPQDPRLPTSQSYLWPSHHGWWLSPVSGQKDEARIKALEAPGTTYKGITLNQKHTKKSSNFRPNGTIGKKSTQAFPPFLLLFMLHIITFLGTQENIFWCESLEKILTLQTEGTILFFI